jgi:hypothetical protein
LSFRTSTAAWTRFSVEERTSIMSSSRSNVVPVSLKSKRVMTSRRAWSRALATSFMGTSDTMSNEKASFAMGQSYGLGFRGAS